MAGQGERLHHSGDDWLFTYLRPRANSCLCLLFSSILSGVQELQHAINPTWELITFHVWRQGRSPLPHRHTQPSMSTHKCSPRPNFGYIGVWGRACTHVYKSTGKALNSSKCLPHVNDSTFCLVLLLLFWAKSTPKSSILCAFHFMDLTGKHFSGTKC